MNARNRNPYLVIVSLDGLATADEETIEILPHFKALLAAGCRIPRLRGVYPSLTYPLHASLITGTYPHRHGITANTPFQPGQENPEWFCSRRAIRMPTLYDRARSRGLRVASLLWPTTGGAAIKYNLPEIVPARPGQNPLWPVLRHGSPYLILELILRFGRQLKGIDRYHLDNFTAASAAHLIRSRRPELLLIHLLDLDAQRHRHGFLCAQARRVLGDQDGRLGQILAASREAGTYDQTAFVVLGDHAFRDVQWRININSAFREAGLLRVDRRGRVRDWQGWANSCDGSAHIYLRDRQDRKIRRRVREVLRELAGDPQNGIAALLGPEEAARLRLGRGMDFVLEARPGYYFSGKLRRRIVEQAPENHRAAHGYLPDYPGYTAFFLASGAGIRPGVRLEEASIVDIGPTLAALLGLTMPAAEGRVLREILVGGE